MSKYKTHWGGWFRPATGGCPDRFWEPICSGDVRGPITKQRRRVTCLRCRAMLAVRR